MVLRCRAYYRKVIYISDTIGGKYGLNDIIKHVLIHHMKLETNIYTGDEYHLTDVLMDEWFALNPKFDIGYLNKIIDECRDTLINNLGIPREFISDVPYVRSSLKLATGQFSNVIKDLVSMRNRDYNSVVIDSLPDLGVLSGGSSMNILDQLPKIKRLERNGVFTTAVWEDGTVTKLKKSDQDEDDFEKLVFFLILKKLCDNNTHKMHSTLTDYLNIFRDATVDIPKLKEEKAEKKQKAKEEKENE